MNHETDGRNRAETVRLYREYTYRFIHLRLNESFPD